MKVDLVALLEIAYQKSDAYNAGKETKEEAYKKSGYVDLQPVNGEVDLYDLEALSDHNLETAIRLHISDMAIEDCCALFGGFGLRIGGEFVLYPQCCGTLSDIESWEKIIDSTSNLYLAIEGHPCPKVISYGSSVLIECADEFETFYPECNELITVHSESLTEAIKRAVNILRKQSQRIELCAKRLGYSNAAKYLVWKLS